ncbi:MAG: histidine kinase [Treponema sp.]|jgi:signal transduction histidine kinase|nr:histidine kinase [Treponema sp.]
MRCQQEKLAVSEEQQRVARDLHDNIGQLLSFIALQIQTVKRELNRENLERADGYLTKLTDVTDLAYSKLREYVFNLRQPYLQEVSFRALLEDFVKHFESELHVSCELYLPETIPVFFDSSGVKNHLLSLTKEAVNNSLKHSGADQNCTGEKYCRIRILYRR